MPRALLKFKVREDLYYVFSVLILIAIVNLNNLNSWFIIDDTANIFCSSLDTYKLLFDRGTYLFCNQLFFTPLLPVSFKIDWVLFKLNPFGYHLHNLLAAFLVSIVFYKLLRMYVSPFSSWLGIILLSVSLPLSFDIGWITRRHYLWGFLLSLTSLYLYKRWEVNKQTRTIVVSLACSFAAILFKEAYAFLPAVIFVASEGSLKDRVQKTIPFIIILAAYLVWRIYILGTIGGYPGSTGVSFLFLVKKLLFVPFDLSYNLIGIAWFPLIMLIVLAYFRYQTAFAVALMGVIVNSPFIFYPSGGFTLANKALAFVAVISFSVSWVIDKASFRSKRLQLVVILFLFFPTLFGLVTKTRLGQEVITRLSNNYAQMYQEIVTNKHDEILIIGNYSYYFSNLEDIYRKMLKEDFPEIKSISDATTLRYLEDAEYDKVIHAQNLDLDPEISALSSIAVFNDVGARKFVSRNMLQSAGDGLLPAPETIFTPADYHLNVEIVDSREGVYMRCLYLGSYVGCYKIPRNYRYKYNSVKKPERVDIIYISKDGKQSEAARYVF